MIQIQSAHGLKTGWLKTGVPPDPYEVDIVLSVPFLQRGEAGLYVSFHDGNLKSAGFIEPGKENYYMGMLPKNGVGPKQAVDAAQIKRSRFIAGQPVEHRR